MYCCRTEHTGILAGLINSKGCFQGMCNCEEDMAVCIDVWVKFSYNPRIRILYLKQLQILDIHLVLENFPSLKYLTMRDMMYFNCIWIKEIPEDIIVSTNMCIDDVKKGEYNSLSSSIWNLLARDNVNTLVCLPSGSKFRVIFNWVWRFSTDLFRFCCSSRGRSYRWCIIRGNAMVCLPSGSKFPVNFNWEWRFSKDLVRFAVPEGRTCTRTPEVMCWGAFLWVRNFLLILIWNGKF